MTARWIDSRVAGRGSHPRPLSLGRGGRRAKALQRGFTLTELMIVVAMIGVLSTLAVVGYRKYVDSAKSSEPVAIIQSIRSAEEEFKDKNMSYLNVSTSGDYYPNPGPFSSKKTFWGGGPDNARWTTLGATVSGGVRFGYKVNAGAAGQAITVNIEYPGIAMPAPTAPWYVIQAKGDPNEDGKPTLLFASSLESEILILEDK